MTDLYVNDNAYNFFSLSMLLISINCWEISDNFVISCYCKYKNIFWSTPYFVCSKPIVDISDVK